MKWIQGKLILLKALTKMKLQIQLKKDMTEGAVRKDLFTTAKSVTRAEIYSGHD